MVAEEVDVVVIGLGPGGEDVAGRLAGAGLDVVGVEARLVGGECPYFACIPTKMMVRAAGTVAEGGRVDRLAGRAEVVPDWTPVAERIRGEATTDWDDRSAVERFERTGGRFLRGRGRITGAGEVTVATADGDQVLRPRRGIVLNPGTEPSVPPIEGLAGTPYWTNREAVRATETPHSLLVLGGGPVGLEFAQVFRRFGARVVMVEAHSRVLRAGEPEASDVLEATLRAEGVEIRAGAGIRRVEHGADGFIAHLDSGDRLTAEHMLVATGRHTDLAALGVAAVGLDESARTVPVDERMRAAEGVWVIGDVTGHGAFTHTSVYQARIAAADLLDQDDEVADYRAVPAVTFTDPEAAMAGLTEAAARERGIRVRTSVTDIASTPRGWIHKAGNEGLIKLVADADRGILVGATVVAPAGGEILGALAVAVHAAVQLRQLRRMIFAYPTFHRAIEAALDGLDI